MLILLSLTSCAVGAPAAFTLKSASVDPSHACPLGANNLPYDLHATIEVRNGTSSTVTIKSVDAVMSLAAVKGAWLEPIGDRYDATAVSFSPASIPAGSASTVNATIPSACTNVRAPTAGPSYGEYAVAIRLITSAGTFTLNSANRHRILAA